MIRLHVDAVLVVRDGFSGQPIAGSALLCTVDGAAFRPMARDGGYLVFTGLGAGEHEIVLKGAYFRDERVLVSCTGAGCAETVVTMKPARGYPFGSSVTRLTLKVKKGGAPAAGRRVWMASAGPNEIKIAQEQVSAGDAQSRVFYKGQPSRFALPGDFIMWDEEKTEVCCVDALEDEQCGFAKPLKRAHKRGRAMCPAQVYTADAAGEIRAVFREPAELRLFDPESGRTDEIKLEAGENSGEFKL